MAARAILGSVLLWVAVAGGGRARAEDAPAPLGVQEAADAVIAALDGSDASALSRLAERVPRDPWVIADELLGRDRRAAALALAKAAAGPEAARLQAWLASAQPWPRHAEVRLALISASAAADPLAVARAAEALRALEAPTDEVLAIVLLRARARLERLMGHAVETLALEREVGERAERLGADGSAAEAFLRASELAQASGDLRASLAHARQALQAVDRRGIATEQISVLIRLGVLSLSVGDATQVAAVAERALALSADGPAAGERARVLCLSAQGHLVARELDAAETRANEGLALPAEQARERPSAILFSVLADVAALRGELATARARTLEAVAAAAAAKDRWGEAWYLRRAAEHSLALGDAAAVDAHMQRARGVVELLGDERKVLELEAGWCDTLNAAGRYADAAKSFLAMAQMHERAGRLEDAARLLYSHAVALAADGRAIEGVNALEAARVRWGPAASPAVHVDLDAYLAENRTGIDDIAGARRAAQASLEGARALADRPREARALQMVARAEYAGGASLEQVERLLRESAGVWDELAHKAQAAEILAMLAQVMWIRGEYAGAMRLLEDIAARCEALKNRAGLADAYAQMAYIHLMLGDLDRAESMAKRSLVAGMGSATPTTLSIAGAALAGVYVMRGTPEKAVQLLEMGVKLAERTGAAAALPDVLGFLAFAYLFSDEPQKALDTALRSQSLHTAAEGTMPPQRVLNEAVALHRLKRTDEALRALDRALGFALELGDTWSVVGVHTGRTAAHLGRDDAAAALASAEEALESMPGMVSGLDQESSSFARSVFSEVYVLGVEAARRLGRPAEALRLAEAGRAGALLEAYGGRQTLNALLLSPAQRQTQEGIRARLAQADARLRSARAQKSPASELKQRKSEYAALLDELSASLALVQRDAKAAARLTAPSPASLERVQQSLRTGEALVLFVAGAPYCEQLLGLAQFPGAAVVVEPAGARIVALPARHELEEAVAAFAPREKFVDPSAAVERLRLAVVEPLALGEHVRRVLISPHGALHAVPFALLLPARDVAYVPSGTMLVALREDRVDPGQGVLAIGRPDYGAVGARPQVVGAPSRAGLADLPATETEARAVGDVVLLRGEATEEALRRTLGVRARWRAVHFACHGVLNAARPTLCALALTPSEQNDGFLTAVEALTWPWSTDIAVLSGCETGRGRVFSGEGTVGLTHSFLAAGVPRVLSSQWVVADDATSVLMTRFYELWNPKDGAQGMDAAAALRGAQEHVRAQPAWAHPYYWAAWTLWGLPE